jgi:vanillate O-demethylase monooxygenase subunit
VLFRDGRGEVVGLADRCAHRFAPLSLGRVEGDALQCPYHGLRFGADGRCVYNPHGDGTIPKAARVKTYPIRERHLAIWIWMGEPERADPADIPDLSFLAETAATDRTTGYLRAQANYLLMADNILDLSHVDFLHPATLGGGSITRSAAEVTERDRSVRIRWSAIADTVPPAFAREMQAPDSRADQMTEVVWSPPGFIHLLITIDAPSHPPLKVDAVHVMTPETETATHYFFGNTRNFHQGDADYNKMIGEITTRIFAEEDKPMVEAQQRRIGAAELMSLKPVLLPVDTGAIRARRRLAALISEESGSAGASKASEKQID